MKRIVCLVFLLSACATGSSNMPSDSHLHDWLGGGGGGHRLHSTLLASPHFSP